MNTIKAMCAATLLAGAICVPAYAQSGGMMSSGDHMKMSAKDKKMMTKCQGMSHDAMMKNAGCKKMMKMHPDMMKGG